MYSADIHFEVVMFLPYVDTVMPLFFLDLLRDRSVYVTLNVFRKQNVILSLRILLA